VPEQQVASSDKHSWCASSWTWTNIVDQSYI